MREPSEGSLLQDLAIGERAWFLNEPTLSHQMSHATGKDLGISYRDAAAPQVGFSPVAF